MLKRSLAAALAALVVSACSDAPPEPGSVAPAQADDRAEFGASPGDRLDARADASVKELFCLNALGEACPADIDEQLAQHAFAGLDTRIDLADAFVRINALDTLGGADAEITNEAYVAACYRVILGREPDEGGYSAQLNFINTSGVGARKTLIESMLRSDEFRS